MKKNRINTQFNMSKLSAGPLYKLKNKELFNIFIMIMALLSKYIFTEGHIAKLIENVMKHVETHDKLSKTALAHESTPEIQQNVIACRGQLFRIKITVDSLKHAPDAETQAVYQEMLLWMRKAKRKMLSYTRVNQALAVQSLSAGYESNSAIEEHLEFLGLTETFAEVQRLNSRIITLTGKRAEDRSYFKSVRFSNREQSLFDLQLLFNGLIAMAHIKSDDQEKYQEICSTIESMIIEAHAMWKIRIARKHNEEEAEDKGEQEGENTDMNPNEESGDTPSNPDSGNNTDPDASLDPDANPGNEDDPIENGDDSNPDDE